MISDPSFILYCSPCTNTYYRVDKTPPSSAHLTDARSSTKLMPYSNDQYEHKHYIDTNKIRRRLCRSTVSPESPSVPRHARLPRTASFVALVQHGYASIGPLLSCAVDAVRQDYLLTLDTIHTPSTTRARVIFHHLSVMQQTRACSPPLPPWLAQPSEH